MSSDARAGGRAIRVEGLAKQYRIGARTQSAFQYESLRESLVASASRGADRLRGFVSGRSPAVETERVWALDGVSFSVEPGEVVGVIGSNGAGKSTLLKILSRITKPTRGWAELRGRVGSLLEVGTGFHPELTGRDNIYLNGAILGMRRAEIARRFDAIVDFSGVSTFIDTPVKRYSSGMYVRLAFAVAAHLEPEILLVDEVLAVGDAEFQKRCLGKMHEVVRGGRTILFVSHNMAAVKALCRRALWLDNGRIAADGPVDAAVDRYLSKGGPVGTHGNVPPDASRAGSGEARLRRVELQNRSGGSVTQLFFGQPFRVLLTFEVGQAIDAAVAGIGVSTLDGTRVASCFSTDGGRSPFDLRTGRHRVAVDVDMTLLPRAYTLDATLVRSNGYDIDSVQRVLDFTALSVARTGGDSYLWTAGHGFVRPAAIWHNVERIDQEHSLQPAERR
jgi:lipopolysaccharide transport system ATP-binding protein